MLSERVEFSRLIELARKGDGRVFCLPPTELARLSAMICQVNEGGSGTAQDEAELKADVRFDIGPDGLPRIGFSVSGQLSLQCQRCLEPVNWPLRLEARLTVLEKEEQTEQIESPFDSVVIDTDGLDLVRVIEDEILAALPMVPVHRDDPACAQADIEDSDSATDAESMHKPFAGLASLVSDRNSGIGKKAKG